MKDCYKELKEMLNSVLQDEEKTETVINIFEQFEEEEERKRSLKQKEGIERAREQGVVFGRPRARIPDEFESIKKEWECGRLTAPVAASLCGIGVSTFYRKVREKGGDGENEEEK